ncbi:MAG TPA: hypothetical protein VKK31_29165 [Thermoanaerobaculia bacterium]|nr:hypothetical protein [Thermoanaerobaculia bacterium]
MAQHPTILIGHGTFGRTVLRHLLASTAARGSLVWQEPPHGSDPSARRLKDLALLCVAGGGTSEEAGRDPDQREIFRDLERQVEEVEPSGEALARAMDRAASRLLAAEDRAADPDRLRFGLDVVVLAQPGTPEGVGELLNLLAPGMTGLGSKASFGRVAEGVERLNFLQILDFEHYWDPSERGKRLRESVFKAVQHWEVQLRLRRPGFGRTYLVDGYTLGGIRDVRYRMGEVVLFLELLLFEGQRNGDLQKLYQRRRDVEPTVGTFGVRLVERSAGLLARLAAAAFGVGWLQHLAGNAGVEGDADLVELRRRLAPYRAARLRQLLAVEELEARRDEGLRRLESGLLALSPDLPDWSAQVREHAQSALLDLKNDLSRWAGDRVRQLDQELLEALPRELDAGIEGALHRGGSPATLGRVMAEIEGLAGEMESLDPPSPREAVEDADPFAALETAHVRYLEARADQVDTGRLKRWWGLLSLVVAAGWTPLFLEALAEVPSPDPASHHLLRWGYEALQWLARPVVAGALLFTGSLAAGRLAFQRSVAERVRRALAFHTDPERGRLADRVRGALAPGGLLRAQVDAFADRVVRDLAARVRSDVQREARRALDLLAERRREALWLRDQLIDFLKGYSLDPSLEVEGFERARRRRGGVRQSLERGEELQELLQQNAPRVDRFRSTQARIQPFRGWADRYCGAFLHPLSFLDELSAEYQNRGGERAAEILDDLLDFLHREGTFQPAFDWPQTEGAPVAEEHCLIPMSWRALPEVMLALSNHRWMESRVSRGTDPGRAYLLRVKLGVSPERLLARQPQTVLPEAL